MAPSYASGALQVTAAASNISMLSPQVSIYNASGTLLAQASNPSAWSDNVTASVPAVVPGQRYYMAVTGDTQTYFDVGAYQLVVSLPQSSPPTSPAPTPPPVVPTPTPTPPQPPPSSRAASGDEYQSTNGDPSGSGHADDPSRSRASTRDRPSNTSIFKVVRREPTRSTLRELRSRCSTLEEG